VHPLQCKAIASARLKNDKVDAAILGQLLRADLLPEAWIAPPGVRQLRALVRHRIQLVRLRTLLRNRIHAVLAGHGYDRPAGCWSGPGRAWLAALELPAASREVIEDDLALIDALQPRGHQQPALSSHAHILQEALPRCSSSAAACRHPARSSSPAPAGAELRALQLAPRPHGGTNQQRRGKARTTVTPSPAARTGHRVRSPRPLDKHTPHGCANTLIVVELRAHSA
jgi:transposase